jgi:hypothetical protein
MASRVSLKKQLLKNPQGALESSSTSHLGGRESLGGQSLNAEFLLGGTAVPR